MGKRPEGDGSADHRHVVVLVGVYVLLVSALAFLSGSLIYWLLGGFMALGGLLLITLVRRAIASSEREARRLRTLVDQSVENCRSSIAWIRRNGAIARVNEAWCRQLGYSRDELIGLSVPDVDPLWDHERFQLESTPVFDGEPGPHVTESVHRRKDGSTYPVEVSATHVEFEGEEYLFAVSLDITERKQAEERLQKAQASLETAVEEIRQLKEQLEEDNLVLREEVRTIHGHDRIVGESLAVRTALGEAEKVAPTDSTVLLLGETGTGKELFARTIHQLSPRAKRPFVAVSCAAISSELVEAELFGHEKGAYTGAVASRGGRFAVADGTTILLDEIGELPLETQAKLLRVLEEGAFEPLGSSKTIRVDVRVIAATNRDLVAAVDAGTFREDLFYRLNVFPITVPPLRERREDIPELIRLFVSEFAERMGKPIDSIPRATMDALQAMPWPGNVRELRNVVERAMIRSRGTTLRVDLPDFQDEPPDRD